MSDLKRLGGRVKSWLQDQVIRLGQWIIGGRHGEVLPVNEAWVVDENGNDRPVVYPSHATPGDHVFVCTLRKGNGGRK